MLNHYPLWKNLLILLVLVVGIIYALPNLYGSDPAIQISPTRAAVVDSNTMAQIQSVLDDKGISVRKMELKNKHLLVRLNSVEDQLTSNDIINEYLGEQYNVALNLAPAAPPWLDNFHARPMYLGLDLRGGLHFLMEVDTETVMKNAYDGYINDIRREFRDKKIRSLGIRRQGDAIVVKFKTAALRETGHDAIGSLTRELTLNDVDGENTFDVHAVITEVAVRDTKKRALQQNITTLRNRVNELGVSEPVIQQQGDDRIVVQLPGIQDSAKAKEILSATATLEFRLVAVDASLSEAINGSVPAGTRLYKERNGNPVLLKRQVIITGESITGATSGLDQETGSPAVFINLDSAGASSMARTTKKNLKKPMAVVFIEYKNTSKVVDGKEVNTTRKIEEVINIATIQGVFSKRFQITGLDSVGEAHDLALLLRAGALSAPIRIVEERTIGPSLGKDNIEKGTYSVMLGMLVVIVFMLLWYRGFGLVANIALTANLVLIMAVLSLLQATLTLPGIAGIVLTVGMAVDANVLIFERIREELRLGNSPQASINAGYEKALSTIADANITTFIAAIVLYIFGTGPIKGFAITLSIGIATSMFTAIMGTRAIINLAVGRRKLKTLSI